ncbi:MAG: MotA/TolQ/ExbB proton channel family protein [Bdellovibrionaceae bacterium]|nr:MotA/TolQ/ExbB proton channel family protein [Pseudobdellovibrionaceae bacterium]MDW8190841.1 MotA/TolQ/ExbB proton channel family protein [Pseudobdellovibrionaceae bacterium]
MVLFPLLIVGSGFIITLVIRHLDQSLLSYFDFVALLIVLGGTLLVAVITLPWEYRHDVVKVLSLLFKKERPQFDLLMKQAISVYQTRDLNIKDNHRSLYARVLQQGIELLTLNLPVETIKNILGDQISMQIRRNKRVAYAIKNLAKYPPAFGLIGTVFGLVNIMKKLASTADASFLGAEMSIALVATMYGLMVANFLLNPIGELLLKKSEEEEEYADIALTAIVLVAQQASYLEFMEQISALVPEHERANIQLKWDEVA